MSRLNSTLEPLTAPAAAGRGSRDQPGHRDDEATIPGPGGCRGRGRSSIVLPPRRESPRSKSGATRSACDRPCALVVVRYYPHSTPIVDAGSSLMAVDPDPVGPRVVGRVGGMRDCRGRGIRGKPTIRWHPDIPSRLGGIRFRARQSACRWFRNAGQVASLSQEHDANSPGFRSDIRPRLGWPDPDRDQSPESRPRAACRARRAVFRSAGNGTGFSRT